MLIKRGKLGGKKGFTLLETLLALTIGAMASVFFGGFLIPQMKFYYDFDRRTQAKTMCSEAYGELEEILRYGYMYHCNPQTPEKLFYYTRAHGPGTREDRENRRSHIPGVETWPVLTAGDLDVSPSDRMDLKLDFRGTTNRTAEVVIQAVWNEEVIYEQEAVINSLYWYEMTEGSDP